MALISPVICPRTLRCYCGAKDANALIIASLLCELLLLYRAVNQRQIAASGCWLLQGFCKGHGNENAPRAGEVSVEFSPGVNTFIPFHRTFEQCTEPV